MEQALIGYGGHAREVMAQMGKKMVCFVDDEYVDENTTSLSEFDPKKYKVMVAIGDSKKRYDVVKKLPKETQYFSFIHNTALIMDDSIEIGEGSFIGAYSILTHNIKIGKHCLLNRSNHIGHDCIIGDYFSMMPGSIVSGNCEISDNVYLGTNSSIREKISICSDVVIGLSSGVIDDINNSGIYVGTPAKKIK
jgi:sugar O-acyltransferase (sialic acid O-acetyltransferase NeuD family)